MSRTLIRFSIPLIGSAAVALGLFACSSDATPPATGTGGSTSGTGGTTSGTGGKTTAGGSAGAGGAATTGGASNAGGKGGGGGAGGALPDPYTCFAAPPRDPGGTVAAAGDCCTVGTAKLGTCTDPATITDATVKASLGHEMCTKTLLCAPKADAGSTAGMYDKCTAKMGADLEGRCLPKCFVAGSPTGSELVQEDCKSKDFVCAPCYNPLDGKATGACSQKAGDKPVQAAPAVWKTCGGGDSGLALGTCVPLNVALASGNAAVPTLKQNNCASDKDICVPTTKAKDPASCAPKCTTADALHAAPENAKYKPGSCQPTFVIHDVAPSGLGLLTKDTCAEDELCAPCLDPLNMGNPSHACE